MKKLIFLASRFFNPVVLVLAGSRIFPFYGILKHRGRRSGKEYRVPVVARPTAEGFTVPMPWGESTDWFRNIRVAGGCRLRWNGRDYELWDPEVVDAVQAQQDFKGVAGAVMRWVGIKLCVKLHYQRKTHS